MRSSVKHGVSSTWVATVGITVTVIAATGRASSPAAVVAPPAESICVLKDLPRWIATPDTEWVQLVESRSPSSAFLNRFGEPTRKDPEDGAVRGDQVWSWDLEAPFGTVSGGIRFDEFRQARPFTVDRRQRLYHRTGNFEALRELWGASERGWPRWIDPAVWQHCLTAGMSPDEVVAVLGTPTQSAFDRPDPRAQPTIRYTGFSMICERASTDGSRLSSRSMSRLQLPLFDAQTSALELDFGDVEFPELRLGRRQVGHFWQASGTWPLEGTAALVRSIGDPALLERNSPGNPLNHIVLQLAAHHAVAARGGTDLVNAPVLAGADVIQHLGAPEKTIATGHVHPPPDPRLASVPPQLRQQMGLGLEPVPVVAHQYSTASGGTLTVYVRQPDSADAPDAAARRSAASPSAVVGASYDVDYGVLLAEWPIVKSASEPTSEGFPSWTETHRWDSWIAPGVPKSWVEAILGPPTTVEVESVQDRQGRPLLDAVGNQVEHLRTRYGPWQDDGNPSIRWNSGECTYVRNPYSGGWVVREIRVPRRRD